MRRFLTLSIMVSIVVALIVSLAGTALAQVPHLVVDPKVVPAGGTFVVAVSGFKAKEAVVVLLVAALAGEDIILTGGECDDKGAFLSPTKRIPQVSEMAAIPAGVKPAKYSVKATGTAGSTATAEITVGPAPTPVPKPTPKPTPAPTPAPKPVVEKPPAVPKVGAPLPIGLIALAGIGLGAIGFALRRRS